MKAARPSISVVIPTFNGIGLLEKHLPHVQKMLEANDEVIIVDDASQEDITAWVESQQPNWHKTRVKLKVIRHQSNQRFAAAVNTGVKNAHHNHVLLINNDVHPLTPNLADQLLAWFEQDADLFAVGCAELTSLEKNAPVSGRGTGRWQRGLLVHIYHAKQNSAETLWTSGGSMMLDREKFLELNGMDTLFRPAYEEDRDLSYRALKRGWHLKFDFNARVFHDHETTNASVFGARHMERMSWKNQYLLVWKNISDPGMLLEHFLWLPYHIIRNSTRTHGVSALGFLAALKQLPECLQSRQRSRPLWRLSDRIIMAPWSRLEKL